MAMFQCAVSGWQRSWREHLNRQYILYRLREKADSTNSIISNALEVLQSISTVPVQCFLMEGKNLAQSTLEFSKKINADLIMVNPVKEFRLPGLWNRLTNNLLSYGSKIPVITMETQDNV